MSSSSAKGGMRPPPRGRHQRMVLSARFEFGLALARPHPGRPPLWLGKATDDEAGGAPMADGKGGAEATTGIGGAVAHVSIGAGGGGGGGSELNVGEILQLKEDLDPFLM